MPIDTQRMSSEEMNEKPTCKESVWGTFHFIAKSDHSMLSNRPVTGLGVRTLSPVVDTLKIPREVLEDIYGGNQVVTEKQFLSLSANILTPLSVGYYHPSKRVS